MKRGRACGVEIGGETLFVLNDPVSCARRGGDGDDREQESNPAVRQSADRITRRLRLTAYGLRAYVFASREPDCLRQPALSAASRAL